MTQERLSKLLKAPRLTPAEHTELVNALEHQAQQCELEHFAKKRAVCAKVRAQGVTAKNKAARFRGQIQKLVQHRVRFAFSAA